jgi:hypothetical protein
MVNILRPVACRLGSSSIPIWQIIFWITEPSSEDLFADYPMDFGLTDGITAIDTNRGSSHEIGGS